ncbi:MAG: GNAT family N-acetyltransferase, partial [Angelakisella sp.]
IRRFKEEDAEKVSELVCRNLIEINGKEYPLAEMEQLAEGYHPDKIKSIASHAHMYVVTEDARIVGTGAIGSFCGSETESMLLTIFVLPEYHGTGVGTAIIKALEQDELFYRANRIELPSSKTACKFYEKMGYHYKNGEKVLDEDGLYPMEKFR